MIEKEYFPAPGDYFVIRWRTIPDRSYIDEVWKCVSSEGDLVSGDPVTQPVTKYHKRTLFRFFDVAFGKVSEEFLELHLTADGATS